VNSRGRPRVLRSVAQELLIAANVELWSRRWKPLRDAGKRGKVGAYRQVSEHTLRGALGPDAVEKIYKRWRRIVSRRTGRELNSLAGELGKMFAPATQPRRLPGYFGNGDRPCQNPRHARHAAKQLAVFSQLKVVSRSASDVELLLHAVQSFELDEAGIIRMLKAARPADHESLLEAFRQSDSPILVKAFAR
jgi:hypothetical protein